MARVTESDVRGIIDTSIVSLTPFITTANLVVDEKLEFSGLSDALLKEIELYLAAHFVAIRDPRTTRERMGEAEDFYEGRNTKLTGFGATSYGQQALSLDITGTLASAGQKQASLENIE